METVMPDMAVVLSRLEQENRNLVARVEKLEKQHRFSITAFLANVILLVSAGFLVCYLGLLPQGIERLPLQAKTVIAESFALRTNNGVIHARVIPDPKGFRVIDEQDKVIFSSP